jgi:hypothetical protein
MRTFLIILILLAVAVIGLGFYLDWFTFTVDAAKIAADVKSVKGS